VDPRARRQALHEHLSQARAAWETGDRPAALRAVEAALRLDPDFLAAQALRDRIARGDAPQRIAPAAPFRNAAPPAAPAAAPDTSVPVVSAEGWARFEQRTRLRRIDKRAEAARTAIAHGRLVEASAAIDEIRAIDANHPDIISLGMELDAAAQLAAVDRHASRPLSHMGPAMAAVAVFAALVLGARWLESPPPSRQATVAAPLSVPAPIVPAPPTTRSESAENGVPSEQESETRPVEPPPAPPETDAVHAPDASVREAERLEPVAARREESVPHLAQNPFAWPPVATSPVPPPAPVEVPEVAPAARAAEAPQPSTGPDVVEQPDVALASDVRTATAGPPVRDEELVRRLLQHYRLAYETLDARSAQAVWPTVNQSVLQRAFDGLLSQQLTFADCDVQVRGETGTAVCRGTARYVPKLGSREARVESRVWSFGLRKAGADWQIDSARTER
jgi:hypothetical protein